MTVVAESFVTDTAWQRLCDTMSQHAVGAACLVQLGRLPSAAPVYLWIEIGTPA
jgi:hypothetical protein